MQALDRRQWLTAVGLVIGGLGAGRFVAAETSSGIESREPVAEREPVWAGSRSNRCAAGASSQTCAATRARSTTR